MSSPTPPGYALLIILSAGLWGGCSAGSAGGSGAASGSSSGGPAESAGSAGAGVVATGGSASVAGSPSGMAGASVAAQSGAAGVAAGGGGAAAGGMIGGAGAGGSTVQGGAAGASAGGAAGQGAGGAAGAGTGAAGAAGAINCNLPATVGFQKDVQPFLTSSCGKGVSSGCHVTDGSKTSLGYDHAYDWITAIAHPGSCGGPPYPKRFEVVLAVIAGADPASCPKSRIMPPAGMGTPLSACQIAALQAWLDEPQVSQTHVPETDDTKNLYPAGPYLMPPFN